MATPPPRNAARKRTAPSSGVVRPDPRDEEEVRLAIADADAGKGILMSAEEAEIAIVTGRWPESSE